MAAVHSILAITYPLLVYLGLKVMDPRQVALSIGALVVVRMLVVAPRRLAVYTRAFWLPVAAIACMIAITAASNHPFSLLLTPVVINAGLCAAFTSSLFQAESTVERLAKIQVPDLSEVELAYCRRVTMVWCGFFVLNGSAALGLALYGDLGIWTFYTGIVSYLLLGTLFACEYVFRHWRFRRYVGAPPDVVLKWLFPPRDAELSANQLGSEEGRVAPQSEGPP